MREYFRQFAAYNQWANACLFGAALALSEADYHRPTGVFFKSLNGTLNHLLITDRMWLRRITGQGEPPAPLNAIIYHDRAELARARFHEDRQIIAAIDAFHPGAFAEILTYQNSTGTEFHQQLQDILAHFFNHQTHHRGQAHACLSILTGAEPPSLDLLAFQRGVPAPVLEP